MKIVTIVGARPQFIKAAVVSREIAKHSGLKEVIVHTGQHHDHNMSEVFFKEMEIPEPLYNLGVHSDLHGAMTGQMLMKIEEVLVKENPDWVLVFGDTNSTLAGALAAKKLNIRLAHVEAGLRSYNMRMPEEMNRIVTDRISDFLFCPTENAIANLAKEGFSHFNCSIFNTGDVMYDAALFYSGKAEQKSTVIQSLGGKNFILCTFHRAENTDDENKLRSIVDALNKLSGEIEIIVPLHPRTKKMIVQKNIPVRFTVVEPVSYFDMIQLTKQCRLVMTDSGGLQKEAFFFNKYCVTLRNETEWVELVDNGCNFLTGSNTQKIISTVHDLEGRNFDFSEKLYGEGNAGDLIVKQFLQQ